MVVVTRNRPSLTAEDWARAGFEAFGEDGLDGVAVERVATRLGTTKGSFYWHFENRDALVAAVLDLWRNETEAIIDAVGTVDDPRRRLQKLFSLVTAQIPADRYEIDLLARAGHPVVAAVIEEVSRRRITFIAEALRQAGLSGVEADDGAVQAYALWIGLLQLQTSLPGTVPSGAARRRFLRSTNALLAGLAPDGEVAGRQRPR